MLHLLAIFNVDWLGTQRGVKSKDMLVFSISVSRIGTGMIFLLTGGRYLSQKLSSHVGTVS